MYLHFIYVNSLRIDIHPGGKNQSFREFLQNGNKLNIAFNFSLHELFSRASNLLLVTTRWNSTWCAYNYLSQSNFPDLFSTTNFDSVILSFTTSSNFPWSKKFISCFKNGKDEKKDYELWDITIILGIIDRLKIS